MYFMSCSMRLNWEIKSVNFAECCIAELVLVTFVSRLNDRVAMELTNQTKFNRCQTIAKPVTVDMVGPTEHAFRF